MVLGLLFAFFFVFDLPGRRRTLNLRRRIVFVLLLACARATRSAVSPQPWPSRRSCMPCKMSCTSSRSVSLLSCGLWFRPVVLATWSLLAQFRLSCCLARPQTRQKPSGSSTSRCHCVQYVLSCLTVQAPCFCPLINTLLISGFSAIPACAIIADAFTLARATIPLASSSAWFGYRVSFRSPLLGASQPLTASASTAPGEPAALLPVASVQVLSRVKLPALSAS